MVTEVLDRLGVEHPVVQAGMGGGIAGGDLAGAVSAAGGLGTVGIMPPARLREELRRAGERAGGRPVAANQHMPFVRREHVEACAAGGARVVALFFGFDRALVGALRERGMLVLHQVGTEEGARRALADGADGLIAQGIEAGGHLLGVEPALRFLERARAVAGRRPVLLAGGVADRADAERALAAGADAVVSGSRFLLTHECRAHPEYKRRALGAERTLDTRLFGFGWPDRHRVLPNAATERWASRERLVGALTGPTRRLGRLMPLAAAARMPGLQRAAIPLYGPAAPLAGMPDRLVEVTPLYAGECVSRIHTIVGAAEAVRELAGAAG